MFRGLFHRWLKNEEGLAAMEAAMIFPILMTLLLGTFDMGNGILANQKTIRASQITADLLARNKSVSSTMLTESIEAGRLAFEPLSTTSYGIDIISIRFDNNSQPQIVWRETQNMTAVADVLDRVAPLGAPGEGVLVVAVKYDFEPIFSGFVVDSISMREIAFARGRKTPVITQE